MSSKYICLFYVLLSLVEVFADSNEWYLESSSQGDCPLWYQRNKTTGECKCGDLLNGIVKCSKHNENHTVSVRTCFCMTLENSTQQPVVGSCLYTCFHLLDGLTNHNLMNRLETTSISDLSNLTCGHYNRKGVQCAECIKDYGKPVYSYSISCVPCKDYKYNWLRYIAVAYLPLSVFYFIIILFRLSASSGLMVAYVTISQMVANNRAITLYLIVFNNKPMAKVVAAIYSIWNLDFFRSLYSPFCLHPSLTGLQVLCLDYLVALYPMILIFLTYLVVQLHDRSRMVVCLCKPFYSCLHRFRKEWNVGNSLIEAFATLILLSFVKILHTSLGILACSHYYYTDSNHSYAVVHADPSIRYLSKEHIPYFVLATLILLSFNILPLLLLCVYPWRCFHTLLSHVRLNHRSLYVFMDAFQGCYKLQPKYMRSFSAVYLIAHFINLLQYFILDNSLYHTGTSYLFMAIIVLLGSLAPYNDKWHNKINITLFVFIFLVNYSIVSILESKMLQPITSHWITFNYVVLTVGCISLPMYGVGILVNHLLPLRIKKNVMVNFLKMSSTNEWEQESFHDSLPHRLQNDDDYVSSQ